MNTIIDFPTAKLLAKKGFDKETLYFYTKPNSKMFGIDELDRYYPIKNTSKKLYRCGEHATLNVKNVYSAPTFAETCVWLYKKYGIWICVDKAEDFDWWKFNIRKLKEIGYDYGGFESDFNSPSEAYRKAITYVLTNLI